jgi:hypothetical protein
MDCLLIPLLIALFLWINKAVLKLLWQRASTGWKIAYCFACVTGIILGVWGGFFFEYQPYPNLRVFSIPFPIGFLHLEGPPGNEEWVDFVSPAGALVALSDLIIIALIVPSLIGLAFWVRTCFGRKWGRF